MTTDSLKYTLDDFNSMIFNGFNYELPNDVLNTISEIALEVGSPNYVKTPIFKKKENPIKMEPLLNNVNNNRKRRGNKNMEIINDNDWELVRSFQATKIEAKVGLDSEIDIIRSYLNKITDKNYKETANHIITVIEKMIENNITTDELIKVSSTIFEIASTNRFYSKIYAELYSELIKKYDSMRETFEKSLNTFIELFNVIEYIDPSVDYNSFCRINKDNEKRKSLAAFFVNLMNNNIISKDKIINIIRNLMNKIYLYINQDNKKNEVDELTENIAILYKKELFSGEVEYELIDGMTISEIIENLAHSKSKNYLSLSNKSIFKFMDLIDM